MAKSATILFSAGAGTGKTTTLSQEYLNKAFELWLEDRTRQKTREGLLFRKVVERILALTFTENAAAEMMVRIGGIIRESEDLLLQGGNPSYLTENEKVMETLKRCTEKEKLSEQKIVLKFLSELRADLPQAHIQTIHSRCMRLIKENATQIGLDPDFRVMDEVETEEMLRDIVRSTLLERIEDADAQKLLYPLFLGKGFVQIVDDVQKLYQSCRNEGERFDEGAIWERTAAEWKGKVWQEVLSAASQRVVQNAENRRNRLNSAERQELATLAEKLKEEKERLESNPNQWQPPRWSHFLHTEKIRQRAAEELPPQDYHEMIAQLVYLLKEIEMRFQEKKKTEGVCDYNDQLFFSLDLFRKSPHLQQALQEQYAKVFVDEAQDLNPIQFKLVQKICSDQKGKVCWEKLFLVGDHKQSIYAFRGADVSLFQSVKRMVSQEKVKRLNRNYRSLPSIIRFVNTFFKWWSQANGESKAEHTFVFKPGIEEGDELEADRQDEGKTLGVYWFGKDWQGDTHTLRCREAEQIAQLILEIQEGSERFPMYPFQKIAILFRSKGATKIYEHALARCNIPYAIVGGTGFYQRQEILDLSCALRCILFPQDILALVGFLRSPLVGLSDEALLSIATQGFQSHKADLVQAFLNGNLHAFLNCNEHRSEIAPAQEARRLIQKLGSTWQQLSVTELLHRLLAETSYLPRLMVTEGGRQKVANVRKLIEIARIYEKKEHATALDFLLSLDRLIQNPPRESESPIEVEGVQLMTIHQAKGKEFEAVFVADLMSKGPNIQGPFFYHKEYGLALQHPIGGSTTKLATSIWAEAIKRKMKEVESEERKRLLYVAMTRARDLLFLCVPDLNRGSKEIWCKILRHFSVSQIEDFTLYHDLPSLDRKKTASTSLPVANGKKKITANQAAVLSEKLAEKLSPKLLGLRKAELSLSRLIDGLLCWRKFYYTAFLNLDEFATLSQLGTSSRLFLVNEGSIAHQILAQMDLTRSPQENKRFLRDALLAQPELSVAERKEMQACLACFLASPLAQRVRAAVEIQQEVPFQAHLLVGASSPFQFYLRGKIDLLFFGKQGSATICEYKYAHYAPLRQKDYNLQLVLYTYMLQQALPDTKIKSSFVFLKEATEKMFYTPPINLTEVVAEMKRKLHQLASLLAISRQESFPCLSSRGECRQIDCKFQPLCWEVNDKSVRRNRSGIDLTADELSRKPRDVPPL